MRTFFAVAILASASSLAFAGDVTVTPDTAAIEATAQETVQPLAPQEDAAAKDSFSYGLVGGHGCRGGSRKSTTTELLTN